MDINKVWLSGKAITRPILTKQADRLPVCFFMLEVNENYVTKDGTKAYRPNYVRIESLGKAAEVTAERVVQGMRYVVEGYLRQDNKNDHDFVKVRTFAVYKDESGDSKFYSDGVKQALDVVRKSLDLRAAIESLESLIK